MKKILNQKTTIRNALIALYVLIVLGFSATARAEMKILPIFVENGKVQTESYHGEVAMTTDGLFYLIVSEVEFYQLAANIDLMDYNGKAVEVQGVEVQHKTGPVRQIMSKGPLPVDLKRKQAAPMLIVLGISELAYQ